MASLVAFYYLSESDEENVQPISKVEDNIFELDPSFIPELEKKIKSLNKKAEKIGVPPISVEVIGEKIKEYTDIDEETGQKIKRFKKVSVVKVVGERPKVAGYDFLATVEGTPSGNILRVAPGAENYQKELQAYYNSNPGLCEWCKERRKRVQTFIVREKATGKLKQVGRNCLKDFLGGRSPQSIAAIFSAYQDLYEFLKSRQKENDKQDSQSFRRAGLIAPVKDILTVGVTATRLFGYRPASFGGETTANLARLVVFGPPSKYITTRFGSEPNPDYDLYKKIKDAINEEDEKRVQEIVSWFGELSDEQKKDPFFHNVNVLFKEGFASNKDVGYIVGLIPVFSKAMSRQYYQKKEPSGAKSNEWVGQIGQKIPPTKIRVIRTRSLTGAFGPVQLVSMEDEQGNVFVWFNNSRQNMEENKEYTITGTVKKHDDYQGRKQTHLTRVKIVH